MKTFTELTSRPRWSQHAMKGLSRTARLPAFLACPDDLPARIADLKAVAIGGGSVGRIATDNLARLGVGELRICDPGRVKRESVLTHPVPPGEIGAGKAWAAAAAAKAVSPDTRVFFAEARAQEMGLAAFAGADVILLATDSLSAEVEVGLIAKRLGIPLLQGAVHGPTLVAHLKTWSNGGDGRGPCPSCQFGARDWQRIGTERGKMSCERVLAGERPPIATRPTMSVSSLCATAGNLLAFGVLRRLLGIEEPFPDSVVEICAWNFTSTTTRLERNPDCPVEHRVWRRGDAAGAPAGWRLADLLGAAGVPRGKLGPSVAIAVDGHVFVAVKACPCGESPPSKGFRPEGAEVTGCPACGRALALEAFSYRDVPAALLCDRLDRTLDALGAGAADSVLIRVGRRTVWFASNSPAEMEVSR